MAKHRTTIQLDEDQHEGATTCAAEEGLTIQEWIVEQVNAALEQAGFLKNSRSVAMTNLRQQLRVWASTAHPTFGKDITLAAFRHLQSDPSFNDLYISVIRPIGQERPADRIQAVHQWIAKVIKTRLHLSNGQFVNLPRKSNELIRGYTQLV